MTGTQAVGNTEIPLESLAPGGYTFVVAVTEASSATTVTRSVDFELVDIAP